MSSINHDRFTSHWILYAASCNAAGWLLSMGGWLNGAMLAITIPLLWWSLARLVQIRLPQVRFAAWGQQLTRKVKQPAFLGFCMLAILALTGGLWMAPNNFDALNYRMPKVAHWLMAGRWEWIHAANNNLNTRSCGFEWLTVPMIAWMRCDRLVFLYNWICFLLLPGLIFSLFRRFGVAARVSRCWMWLLPSGYCFALQAGSVANDLPAAMFALAAFDLGMKWRQSRSWCHMSMSLLAASMMTAIKPTTLPLLLPYGILFFGMWRGWFVKPALTSLWLMVCSLASFLPTAALNHYYSGDWTGAAAENPTLAKVKPLYGLAGNLVNAPLQNLSPPLFPLATTWNRWVVSTLPDHWAAEMAAQFELRAAKFGLVDIQGEESAGIGLGITGMWLLAVGAAGTMRRHGTQSVRPQMGFRTVASVTLVAALLVYFSKTGMNTVARHIAPYYPLLLMLGLTSTAQTKVIRKRWWKVCWATAVSSSLVMIIITPSRPLWPAAWFFNRFGNPSSPTWQRAKMGYEVYANRADGLGILRDTIPVTEEHIGLITFASGPELPLWKPYLKRKVRHFTPGESARQVQQREKINYLVINTMNFADYMGLPPEVWLRQQGGKILLRKEIKILVKERPSEWWVVKLPKN